MLNQHSISLSQIIEAIDQPVELVGLGGRDTDQVIIKHIAPLSEADQSCLSVIYDKKYADQLPNTQAMVVVLPDSLKNSCPHIAISTKQPQLVFAQIAALFDYQNGDALRDVQIDSSATIHSSSMIGSGVQIGKNCKILANAVIEDQVVIGDGTIIGPNTVIHHHSQIGRHCRIDTGVVIGAQGFGFAPDPKSDHLAWQPIAQLGRAILGNHVYVGANSCIDRGALGDTVIEDHVIIDNLVMIAHNVRVGESTAIAANTGIAGSTKIGKRCMIGGGVGITGHIEIVDGVTLSGMAMVTGSIKTSGHYASGTSVQPVSDWRRSVVTFKKLSKSPALSALLSKPAASYTDSNSSSSHGDEQGSDSELKQSIAQIQDQLKQFTDQLNQLKSISSYHE